MNGPFCMSLHSGSVGLFRKYVFLARALLNNCTELVNKPSKQLTTTRDVHIDDKLEYLLAYEKAVEVTGNPYLVTCRMIPKKPKDIKQLTFPGNSQVLKQLLELPNKTQEELRKATNDIETQKQELQKHLMTDEEHQRYIKMSETHQIRYIRAKKPNAKGRIIPMKKFKQSKIQKHLNKLKTFMTWNTENIMKIEQLKLPIITDKNENEAIHSNVTAIENWTSPSQSDIDQIKENSYKKGYKHNLNAKANNKVTFGRATKIFLNKPSEQKSRTEPTIPIELFNSPEDQTLDRALDLCQSVGYNSTKLLKKHKAERNMKKTLQTRQKTS